LFVDATLVTDDYVIAYRWIIRAIISLLEHYFGIVTSGGAAREPVNVAIQCACFLPVCPSRNALVL